MILHWYFARRFALAFSYVLGGFLILVALLDFIEQMRRFRGLDVTLGQKVQLDPELGFSMSVLDLPRHIDRVTLLGHA